MTTIEKLKATKQKTLSEVFTLKCRSQVEIQNATEEKQMQYIREGKRAKALRQAIISEGVEDEKLSTSKQKEIDEYARIKGYKNLSKVRGFKLDQMEGYIFEREYSFTAVIVHDEEEKPNEF